MEIWKDIDGYQKYKVSNLGNVKTVDYRHTKKHQVLKPDITRGYYYVNLFSDGKGKKYKIHRLVAQAFINNPEDKPQVNHKDCNKLNNNVYNLEWCTAKENVNHAWENGMNKATLGEENNLSKLTEKDVIAIRRLGRVRKRKEIAEAYGIKIRQVYRILSRENWKHVPEEITE